MLYINSSNLGVNNNIFCIQFSQFFAVFQCIQFFQAERTPDSRSSHRTLPIPNFSCRTEPYSPIFGHIIGSIIRAPRLRANRKKSKNIFLKGVVENRMYHQMQKASPRFVVHPFLLPPPYKKNTFEFLLM